MNGRTLRTEPRSSLHQLRIFTRTTGSLLGFHLSPVGLFGFLSGHLENPRVRTRCGDQGSVCAGSTDGTKQADRHKTSTAHGDKRDKMSRPPSSQTTPQFYRVNERDLTEIELHSVDSINDLHRTHPEHSHRGVRPPRPAYTPHPNGNVCAGSGPKENAVGGKWQNRLPQMLTPSSSRGYALGCAVNTVLLLTVLLIFYFVVQQGEDIRRLTQAVSETDSEVKALSLLIQQCRRCTHNVTEGP